MAKLWYSDFETVIEAAENYGDAEAQAAAKNLRTVFNALHESRVEDHRDLWEYGTENVHPARVTMTTAAKDYKAAEQRLEEARHHAKHPRGKYKLTAYAVNRKENHLTRDIPNECWPTAVHITAVLTNRNELDQDLHYWGSGDAWDNQRSSVLYYAWRVPNTDVWMIKTAWGGTLLLKDDIVLTNINEWLNMISTGTVPEKWLR
jgi:hypothetical protein